MNCPVCNKEAELFAEVKPDGWIGCFCINCSKIYVTRDPEKGWKQAYDVEAAKQDLIGCFSLDAEKELISLAKCEFSRGDFDNELSCL